MAHDQPFILSPRRPGACRPEDLAAFEALVLEGDEVDPVGLSERIEKAERLAFAYHTRTLIGVGALKRPDNSYRRGVFTKAGGEFAATEFPFELGWVYVNPDCRRRGVARRIVDAVLHGSTGQRVFATSKSENRGMHICLEHSGFVRKGEPFPSKRGAHRLVLFVR